MNWLVAGALFVTLAAHPARAGVIEGTLRVPGSSLAKAQMNPYPGQAGSLPGSRDLARGLASDAVVFVDRISADAESVLARRAARPPQLAQKDQAFAPRVIAVAVGARVDFPNQDPIYHNVFSLSPAKRFDLGKYPKGQSRQVVFNKAGLINVFCDIHSDMAAFVYVLPHHAFTRPDAAGAFTLPTLPAGRYVLRVWHPDLGERKTAVEVPASGRVTANLEF